MKKEFIFLLFFVSSCETNSADINCENKIGQAETLYCAQIDFEMEDDKLNNVYKKLKSVMNKEQDSLLLTSQRAWLAMRDSYCDLYTYENRGTTGFEVERTDCLLMLTAERVEHLNKLFF